MSPMGDGHLSGLEIMSTLYGIFSIDIQMSPNYSPLNSPLFFRLKDPFFPLNSPSNPLKCQTPSPNPLIVLKIVKLGPNREV